jgi:hypothetical protein
MEEATPRLNRAKDPEIVHWWFHHTGTATPVDTNKAASGPNNTINIYQKP